MITRPEPFDDALYDISPAPAAKSTRVFRDIRINEVDNGWLIRARGFNNPERPNVRGHVVVAKTLNEVLGALDDLTKPYRPE